MLPENMYEVCTCKGVLSARLCRVCSGMVQKVYVCLYDAMEGPVRYDLRI